MKGPKETVQTAKKGNCSVKQTDMMAPTSSEQSIDVPRHKEMIAVAAYFRAEKRGFAPGNELGDWLHAEAERNSEHEG